ncbi:MAG: sensor histidine kinase [Chloroflexi bacterium]|nr:sensor histidine kinase [Chloroflexota bacterium]
MVTGAEPRRRLPDLAGLPGGRWLVRALGPLGRLSLAQRFALACLAVLLTGALVIGRWVSQEIQSGVIHRTSAITALYVDSFVTPQLGGLETGDGISDYDAATLTSLMHNTPLGEKIVSFKVWSPDGEVLFALEPLEVGKRYPISGELEVALDGQISSHLSNLDEVENQREREQHERLVETYMPVRSGNGQVMAVVEFYQLPDDLVAAIRSSQRTGWGIVGASTVVMYALLVGLVTGASRTITRQNRSLQAAVDQRTALEQRIRALNGRLRRAAGAKAQTDEQVLQRITQDLHDGPAQDLALALLRFEEVRRPDATAEEQQSLATIQFAVEHALTEVRSISTGLHLPQIDGMGWKATVEKAASEHQRRTSAVVHVEAEEVPGAPSPAQRIAAYRIVHEALSNASRHSGAQEAWVRLKAEDGSAVIAIEDHGSGFNVGRERASQGRRARLGLQGMRERAELLGGAFAVRSAPGRGTTVEVRIPLTQGDDHVR